MIMKAYLTTDDLAERYGVSAATIRDWRLRGNGPVATKLNGAVRFAAEDVLAWEKANRETEAAAAV
jgi:predicted site-specific integrase-resolvase